MASSKQIAERSRMALARIRKVSEENQADLKRKAAAMGTAFALGSLTQTGKIMSIPTLFGIPRIATIAIVANVAALMADKNTTTKDMLDGVGDASLSVALFQIGMGQTVAGVHEHDVHSAGDEIARARHLERQIASNVRKQQLQALKNNLQQRTEAYA